MYAEFNVPSVQDQQAGTIGAVISRESDVGITSSGGAVTLRDGEILRDLLRA